MFMTQLSQDKVVYFLTATVLFLLIVTLPNEPGPDCMFSSGTLATETMLTFENLSGFNRGLMEPKNRASRRTWTRLEGTSCTRRAVSQLCLILSRPAGLPGPKMAAHSSNFECKFRMYRTLLSGCPSLCFPLLSQSFSGKVILAHLCLTITSGWFVLRKHCCWKSALFMESGRQVEGLFLDGCPQCACYSHAFWETDSLRRTMQIVECSLLRRRAQGRVSS